MAEVPLVLVAAAFFRRELAIVASYRLLAVFRVVAALLSVATLAFLARFVDEGGSAVSAARYGAAGYLGFWLVGLCMADLFGTVSLALAVRIHTAQVEGTLEAMLSTPAPASHVVLGAPLVDFVFAGARVALYLALGALLFDVSFVHANPLTLVLTAVLSIAAFSAFALLAGAVTLSLRRTDPMRAVVGLAATFLGGVLFPADVLPPALQLVAYTLPIGPSLEATRRALFAGASPSAVAAELAWLAIFIAVVLPAGAWAFAYLLRRARVDGSLGQY